MGALADAVESGTIAAFDEHVGLGYVETTDGRRLLFHCTQIADGTRSIATGTAVTFATVERWKGPEAYNVAPST